MMKKKIFLNKKFLYRGSSNNTFDVLSISKLSPSVFGVHRILSSDIIRPPIL